MTKTRDDVATKILSLLLRHCTPSQTPWCEAMLGELDEIEERRARFRWAMGGANAILQESLRGLVQRGNSVGDTRPFSVTLIAGYHFLFSGVLIVLMTWQLPRITEPWKYAVPVLIMSYGIALVPAILGFGLFIRDEAARVGTIIFSIAHLLLTWEYLRRGLAPHLARPIMRIALDVLIIFVLNLRTIRRKFQLSPISLHLP